MENMIAVLVIVILVGSAAAYLIKAKRSGVKCVGCPAGGNCSSKNKKKKKKLTGPVIAKKTMFITGMHCEHCVQSVTDSLNRIDGVSARVDLNKSCAEISLDREIGEVQWKKKGFQLSLFKARPWYFIWEKAGMNGEKESIIIKLKENGCRITKQRKMILDIILEDRCSSCKEIYARVVKLDQSIGMATVYRLVKELENIGVLSREIVYK